MLSKQQPINQSYVYPYIALNEGLHQLPLGSSVHIKQNMLEIVHHEHTFIVLSLVLTRLFNIFYELYFNPITHQLIDCWLLNVQNNQLKILMQKISIIKLK